MVLKCDLTRPACKRCIKYGVKCPGYRDEQQLVWCGINDVNFKKQKRKKTPHFEDEDVDVDEGGSVSSSSSQSSVVNAGGKAVRLPKSLHQHWTSQSIPMILNVYSTLFFLHDMYRQTNDGPLVWAAHLFSRTYVTIARYPTAMYNESVVETDSELGAYLGKTLSTVHRTLKTPDGAFRDDVLATVWILANYEVFIFSSWLILKLIGMSASCRIFEKSGANKSMALACPWA